MFASMNQKSKKVLVEKIRVVVHTSVSLRVQIAIAMNVNPVTVWRWSKSNDPQLCDPKSLALIKKRITIPSGESYTTNAPIVEPHYYVD